MHPDYAMGLLIGGLAGLLASINPGLSRRARILVCLLGAPVFIGGAAWKLAQGL